MPLDFRRVRTSRIIAFALGGFVACKQAADCPRASNEAPEEWISLK